MDLVAEIIAHLPDNALHYSDVPSNSESIAVLKELLEESEDIVAALISTADGRPWAEVMPDGSDARRYAAISAGLLNLSSTLARDASNGELINLTLEGMEGNIYLMPAGSMVLTIFTRLKPNLGLTLAHARRVADKIVLRARQAAEQVEKLS